LLKRTTDGLIPAKCAFVGLILACVGRILAKCAFVGLILADFVFVGLTV